MRVLLACLIIVTAWLPASYAREPEMVVVDSVLSLVKQGETAQAKQYLTTRSHSLFDRVMAHHPQFMLPSTVTSLGTEKGGAYRYLRLADGAKSKKKTHSITVAFAEEKGHPRMDLPETFRRAFGEDWSDKIDMIEAGYVLAKAHLGEKESRQALEMLIQNYQ